VSRAHAHKYVVLTPYDCARCSDQMYALIKKMHREKNKALKNARGAVQRKTTTTMPKPSKRRDR
jgi:hypothetical protein